MNTIFKYSNYSAEGSGGVSFLRVGPNLLLFDKKADLYIILTKFIQIFRSTFDLNLEFYAIHVFIKYFLDDDDDEEEEESKEDDDEDEDDTEKDASEDEEEDRK